MTCRSDGEWVDGKPPAPGIYWMRTRKWNDKSTWDDPELVQWEGRYGWMFSIDESMSFNYECQHWSARVEVPE